MNMIIGVNTRLLLKNKLEGIGWFTFETLKRIVVDHPEHTFVFIFDRPYHQDFIFGTNVIPVVTGPPARHPILFYWWFEWSIPAVLKKYSCDLFLSPDGYLSLNSNIKQLAVIHDLNFAHYPKDLPWLVRMYYNYFFPRFAKKATRIATVSNYSKQDIHNLYGIATENIDTVYNGVNEKFKAITDDLKVKTRAVYSLECDYFVFVGSLHPRKNIVRLFKAFDLFKSKRTENDTTKLLIVGEKYWWNNDLKATFDQMIFKRDVIFTGRLESEELNNVIASSLALTYVPYFEGFGIPILEGYKCQTPVITANVTSMPEVAGVAALLVNPFDINEISNAMEIVANYTPLERQEKVEKGLIQLSKFSWNQSAESLWKSILTTLN